MNKKATNTYTNMRKLGEYLQKQSKKQIFLTIEEIENIINTKLPKSAKKAKWWSNNSLSLKSQCWLSNNYKVTEAEHISNRSGICFERIDSKLERLIKNFIFNIIITFLITVIGGVISSLICSKIYNNIELKNAINSYYNLSDVEEINFAANDIIYKLDKKKDYDTICDILKYRYFSLINNLELSEHSTTIIDVCLLGIEYAQKCNSTFYEAFFYNSVGEIYLNQYKETFNISDAYTAIYYLKQSNAIHGWIPCNHIIIDEKDKNLELETIRTDLLLTDTYYKLIENGEYTPEEYNLNYESEKNVFCNLYQNIIRCDYKLFSANNKLEEKYGFNVYTLDKRLYLEVIISDIKNMNLLYLTGQKEQLDWAFNRINIDIDESINTLNNLLSTANEENDVNSSYEITYELMRLYFFKILQGEFQYESKFIVCADYCLNTELDELYICELGNYFIEIKSGNLLDLYIEALENKLSSVDFSKNTSYYSYSYYSYLSLELAKHYYYKAFELNKENANKEQVCYYMNLSKLKCEYANYFFKNQINKRAFNELVF